MAIIDYDSVEIKYHYQAIELANVEIIYQPEEFMPQERLLDAKAEIHAHIFHLAQYLAVNLSLALQSPVFVSDIEIIDGSVIAKFSIYIRDKLLMPALAGYMAAMSAQVQAPELPQPQPIQKAVQEQHYETCNKIEKITEKNIVEYDEMTGFKSSKITIKTKTIEELCTKMFAQK